MRKYLEQEMLADCLHGRVRYSCTSYVGMDGCRVFEIYVDGELLKRFSWETVNTYFIENGYKKKDTSVGIEAYWNDFWILMDTVPIQARSECSCTVRKQATENKR